MKNSSRHLVAAIATLMAASSCGRSQLYFADAGLADAGLADAGQDRGQVPDGGAEQGTWSVVTALSSVTTSSLKGVFATGPEEAWAVGASNTTVRWDGMRWSADHSTTSIYQAAGFEDVWASGPGDFWLVGSTDGGGRGFTLRLVNGRWVLLVYTAGAFLMNVIWGTSANDIWVAGKATTVDVPVLWHWDGTTLDSAGSTIPGAATILGLTGAVPGEFWAVLSTALLARHPPGGAWEQPSSPPGVLSGGIWVRRTSPMDVWVTGTEGALYHFDGRAWVTVQTGVGTLADIHASGADDAWAVGAGGALVHFDGVAWRASVSPTTADLHSVHGTGPMDIWAVGSGGTVLHFANGSQNALCGGPGNCRSGLLCCNPCGVGSCHNRCLQSATGGGCP